MEINKYNVGDTVEINDDHANSLLELHNIAVSSDSQIAELQRAIYELEQKRDALVNASLNALLSRNIRMREIAAFYGIDFSNSNQSWDFSSESHSLKRIR